MKRVKNKAPLGSEKSEWSDGALPKDEHNSVLRHIGGYKSYSDGVDELYRGKRVPNSAPAHVWPAGSVAPDRARHGNRRPTAAEERDEVQSKLYNGTGYDAQESAERHEAAHAHEVGGLNG